MRKKGPWINTPIDLLGRKVLTRNWIDFMEGVFYMVFSKLIFWDTLFENGSGCFEEDIKSDKTLTTHSYYFCNLPTPEDLQSSST